ncbi:MAG: sulfatase [Zavarzinella sp.]
MTRFLFGCLLFLLATPLWAAPRNVVLFVTDDQGQDAGCYGNKVLKTPHLDRLAKEGVLFDYAFATTASCSASRSVILTGMHNHANGHYGHQHAYHKFSSYDNVKSLPVQLAAGGYRTARVGKYHVAPEDVYKFDQALPGNARNPVQMANNCKKLFAEASDKPFFLYFCTADPHRSGGSVAGDPLKPNPFGNTPKGYPGVTEVKYDPKDVEVPAFLPDTPTSRAELAQYYQSISRIDQGLGQLIQNLQEAGQLDNTMIIYIADHGIAFPGAKTTTYEPGLRAPCVVRNPFAKRKGEKSQAMVSWVDLTPTILDFAGIKNPAPAIQGKSFLPVLDAEPKKGWDKIYASHTFHEITMYYPMRVVRERQYKLIWNMAHPLPYPFASDLWEAPTWQEAYKQGPKAMYGKRTVKDYIQRPAFELYDLENDPHEAQNLAGKTEYAEILKKMQADLKEFQKQTKDPWILKWEYE